MTQLQPSRCKLAEFQRAVYAINPEAGTPFEALLATHYWAHVSQHFRPGCRLEIFPPEGDYYAELIVQDCGRLFAKVALLRKVDLSGIVVGDADGDLSGYALKYCGPHAKWCVHRKNPEGKTDLLKSEFEGRDDAEAWLRQHVKTVGRQRAA